ncbi:plasmid mobilization protein [Salmonella enterica]
MERVNAIQDGSIIRKKAEDARLTVSAYIRSAALNKRVHS